MARNLIYFNDPRHESDTFYADLENLREPANALAKIIEFVESDTAKLFIRPFLLISGEALIGKTHLFCDVVSRQMENGKQSLLFLGHVLSHKDQIEDQLLSKVEGLDSFEAILEDLDLIGENEGTRPTIFIDAINEAGPNKIWFEQLQGFINKVSKYPNVSLALSVRDVTKKKVISETLEQSHLLTEVRHPGLAYCDDSVLSSICTIFEIDRPSIPLLHNIDYNPGLLFLFFESLYKKGVKSIDFNEIRPSSIFENLFKGINQNIARKLELDSHANYVGRCLNIVAEMMFDAESNYLSYSEVHKNIMNDIHNEKILSEIISEGVFITSEVDGDTKISFTYQKFENYFIANFVLDKFEEENLPIKDIWQYLAKSKYSKVLDDFMLLEALSVLVPERYQRELVLLAGFLEEGEYYQELIDAFLNSLYWRNKASFNDLTIELIKTCLRLSKFSLNQYFDICLRVSSVHNHPLNSIWLHNFLIKRKLSEIDRLWGGYLLSNKEDILIDNTIEWVLENGNAINNLSTVKLFGLTLGWFLSTSNRKVRDKSTKALVALFTGKIPSFLELLKEFKHVDDLYIKERLYAVGYGILHRTKLTMIDRCLADYIYKIEFEDKIPTPNLLIREYARNIVKKTSSELNITSYVSNFFEPPYTSKFQLVTPSIGKLSKYEDLEGFSSIWSSLMYNHGGGIADFGNYVVNACLNDFSNISISSPVVPKQFKDVVDTGDVQKWIFNKIVRMGYDPKVHGEIDKRISSSSRYDNSVERIGKKYQWLGLYEILARLSDVHKAIPEYVGDQRKVIRGSWEIYLRNIDPTFIEEKEEIDQCGFVKGFHYEFPSINLEEWLEDDSDIPSIQTIIEGQVENEKFLVLDTFISKSEKEIDWRHPRKQIHFSLHSALVAKGDLEQTLENLKQKKIRAVDLFRDQRFGRILLKEFFDSEAYQFFSSEYYGGNSSFSLKGKQTVLALKTTDQYFWERGYDYSIDEESITKMIPSEPLYKTLQLKTRLDKNAVYDRGATAEFISNKHINSKTICLAVKPEILKLLEEKELAIVWFGWFEKNIIHCPENIKGMWPEKNYSAYYENDCLIVEEY